MPGEMPSGMQTYGQRLGARQVNGLANWSEEVLDSPAIGMSNFVSQSPHPKDGLRRRAEIIMRNDRGSWEVVADAIYDGECWLEEFRLRELDILSRDQRISQFVKRYATKVGTLDCLSTQRDYPLQSPWHPWLLLRPGEVEVVG
jgi:hypothetical protein